MSDLFAGKRIKGISRRYHEFLRAIAYERDNAFPNFAKMYPVINDYWNPENQMQDAALVAIGISPADCQYKYGTFFDNLHKVKRVL